MKQVLIREGRVVVQDMPPPECGPGEILVRTAFSLISAGTESQTLEQSAPEGLGSVWARRARKLGEAVQLLAARGVRDGTAALKSRIEGTSWATGYSLSGTVVRVGREVHDLAPGQRVACAGSASAHHAEIVAVPRQLVAAVPPSLSLEHAACVTLGAIALHGVRQADLRLGEFGCVVGLGMIGQLSAALLHAAGCRVLAVDTDASRVERARSLGLELVLVEGRDVVVTAVEQATAGRGVDAVLLTAATDSSEPLRQAIRLLRRRGRVVVVGSVGMELDRGGFYEKEAELRMASSYGPGRYDPSYEERGVDYPYSYVRWTENRNMSEFLRLAAEGALQLEQLVDRVFALDQAPAAYDAISDRSVERRPLGALLRYPSAAGLEAPNEHRSIEVVPARREHGLAVALVGPGSFAQGVHLPNVASLGSLARLRWIVGGSPNGAREAGRRWAAERVTTDLQEALDDDGVDVVLISTRHDLHADHACRALEAGKAVFLEKPAGLEPRQLDRLERCLRSCRRPFTLGFNRRFAPDVVALRERLDRRQGPLVIQYRVNADRLPGGHWLLGPQGGGRLVGEACHMIDLLGSLVGARRVGHRLEMMAPPAGAGLHRGDNFTLVCRYEDGSLTCLTYTSLGDAGRGKERIEAHWDGSTAVIDDFRGLEMTADVRRSAERAEPDKGHRELLRRFLEHAAGGAAEPIPWDSILATSRFVLSLDAEARGEPTDAGTL
jgi:predicted dehydrogenase